MTQTLLSLGHGFSAGFLADDLLAEGGWRVLGTTRSPDKCDRLRASGVEPVLWTRDAVAEALSQASHVLVSAAPDDGGDPSLALIGEEIARAANRLTWVGYLSTTGVYGDADGAWVDETAPLNGQSRRARARIDAEAQWAAIPDLPVHIFRLAGIYGPGRGPFEKVRNGTARRIIKPGQVFSRIHGEDISRTLRASMARPNPGAAYNVCDNDPAPPQDVLAYAAELLGLPLPPEVDFEDADMSPMARSFYADNKRVDNTRLHEDLGVTLKYPDYKFGLRALLAAEG
ncbi:nucleoside-diphosphate-sugar epimerase [Sagittula marina]|uniref:Nucleoside-diphosphate-sugar epimerase n=1 Tax=Sagittula marina TaxID=943940 RepID=A0A7W6DMP2_9RHOB|nr:SDR family oxidoreductase [Sagittula marina]MBB3985956.1 nucleoside-diphosphate-sugar epimerase [Sagittula marina]